MEKSMDENIELFNFMRKVEFFSMMDKNALWPLTTVSQLRKFKPGELIIKENSEPEGIFIIKKGKVEVFKTLKDNKKLFLSELQPGQIVGEISVIDKRNTISSVRALDEVDCVFISEWDFTTQLHAYPEIGLQLLPVLTARIRVLSELIL